jgi:hypothetical protein
MAHFSNVNLKFNIKLSLAFWFVFWNRVTMIKPANPDASDCFVFFLHFQIGPGKRKIRPSELVSVHAVIEYWGLAV